MLWFCSPQKESGELRLFYELQKWWRGWWEGHVLHNCSKPKYPCNIAKVYTKKEGPFHFSVKHKMSLETTVMTSLAKDCEFRLPPVPEQNHTGIVLLQLQTPLSSCFGVWVEAEEISPSLYAAHQIDKMHSCFLDGWCQWRVPNGSLGLLHDFQLTTSFWSCNIFALTEEGFWTWAWPAEITKRKYSDYGSVDFKPQLLITWNFCHNWQNPCFSLSLCCIGYFVDINSLLVYS